jgi:hypothetical protein
MTVVLTGFILRPCHGAAPGKPAPHLDQRGLARGLRYHTASGSAFRQKAHVGLRVPAWTVAFILPGLACSMALQV